MGRKIRKLDLRTEWKIAHALKDIVHLDIFFCTCNSLVLAN